MRQRAIWTRIWRRRYKRPLNQWIEYGVIAIAHRLSTVKNADRIYTVEDGELLRSEHINNYSMMVENMLICIRFSRKPKPSLKHERKSQRTFYFLM